MTITVKKVALKEHPTQTEGHLLRADYAGLVESVEVECTVRVGTLTLTIAQLRELKTGQSLHLEQKTSEPLELVLNDKVIARGELMAYMDNFAIQITEAYT